LTAVRNQISTLAETVWTAIDNKLEDNGHITGDHLRTLLNTFKTTIIRDIGNCFARHNGGAAQELVPRHNQQGHRNVDQSTFAYHRRFWEIPKDFKFPFWVNLNTGWQLWLLEQDIGNEQTTLRVKLFHKLTLSNLPNKKKASKQETKGYLQTQMATSFQNDGGS
jgi:hypothetical protein